MHEHQSKLHAERRSDSSLSVYSVEVGVQWRVDLYDRSVNPDVLIPSPINPMLFSTEDHFRWPNPSETWVIIPITSIPASGRHSSDNRFIGHLGIGISNYPNAGESPRASLALH